MNDTVLLPGEKVYVRSLEAYGTVVYCRMAPPMYDMPECYSVLVFGRAGIGTIVLADDVERAS